MGNGVMRVDLIAILEDQRSAGIRGQRAGFAIQRKIGDV